MSLPYETLAFLMGALRSLPDVRGKAEIEIKKFEAERIPMKFIRKKK